MGFKNADEIYGELDVVIIPSLCDDAFPRVLIESYSHGVPVIATCRGGVPEMIDERKTGLIFDPSADGDLESKIRQLVDNTNLMRGMSDNCLQAAGRFDLNTTVEEMISVYGKVFRDGSMGER